MKLKIIFSILTLAVLSACGGPEAQNRYKDRSSEIAGGQSYNVSVCNGQNIRAALSISGNIQQAVGDLVSATFDPSELGTISKVEVELNLELDANRQVISEGSDFVLRITDSIGVIEIAHTYDSSLSGHWDPQSKNLQIQFQDDFGSISVSSGTAEGGSVATVSFANSVAWNGGSPRSGSLGSFSLSSCTF